jgi:hypothetical protein
VGVLPAVTVTSPARAEVVISTKPTQNMNCNAGVCMPTAKNAVLNVGDVTSMLAAKKNITVKAPVMVAGTGALTLNYNQGNGDGDLLFQKKGKFDFQESSSQLRINGIMYALIWNVRSLIAGMKRNRSGNFAIAKDFAAGSTLNHRSPDSLAAYLKDSVIRSEISGLTIRPYETAGFKTASLRKTTAQCAIWPLRMRKFQFQDSRQLRRYS